jgi:predicted O-linked N-acetylglucosamine transferase (SPINDLY family)
MISDAQELFRSGKVADAVKTLQDHLRRHPDDVPVLMQLAGMAANVGAVPQALAALRKVVQVEPGHGHAWFGIADLEAGSGNLVEADRCYRRAGQLLPSESGVPYNHGVVLERLGQTEVAMEAYREAIIRRNDFAQAHNNLGALLLARGENDLAARHFQAALRADPTLNDAAYNLALILEGRSERADAESLLRHVLQRDGTHQGALIGLARLLTGGRPEQRLEALELSDRAIANQAEDPAAHHSRGVVLERLRRARDAAESFREAWRVSGSSMPVALSDLALALHKSGSQYREALEAMSEFSALQPLDASQLLTLINLRLHFCEWDTLGQDVSVLREAIARGESAGKLAPALAVSVPGLSEEEMHRVSTDFATDVVDATVLERASDRPRAAARDGRPLRVGYLSADFREHAVSHVLAGVLEHHEVETVVPYAYSWAQDDGSAMIARLRTAFGERFRDINAVDDAVAADMIRADGIDILVDLTGWTANARYEILLHDPAPLKVNWLGYAGSMGHRAFADYLIGDAVTTPESSAPWFSEALALMPRTYMPTDNRRVRGPRPSRAQAGLPDAGVVFCCFNQPYKITPDVFAVWCQLLHEVPGSVLWLASPHRDARANLLREAASRGIDATRLVFAPFTPTIQEHLGRLQLADIALDTAPYNSHSTGVDALWCGVPLVCVRGQRFAGRVGASLVTAAGVPELAVDTLDDYHRLALALATDAAALQAVKARLTEARDHSPLFDTAGFARDLETLYLRIWQSHCEGRQAIIRPLEA